MQENHRANINPTKTTIEARLMPGPASTTPPASKALPTIARTMIVARMPALMIAWVRRLNMVGPSPLRAGGYHDYAVAQETRSAVSKDAGRWCSRSFGGFRSPRRDPRRLFARPLAHKLCGGRQKLRVSAWKLAN